MITAPFSGVVSARLVQVGEMAVPGREIVTLYDPKDMRVIASIPQSRLGEVRAHATGATGTTTATVELPGLNQWVKGKAVTVLPAADAQTHTTLVRVDLPGEVKGAYPGMFARAYFADRPCEQAADSRRSAGLPQRSGGRLCRRRKGRDPLPPAAPR